MKWYHANAAGIGRQVYPTQRRRMRAALAWLVAIVIAFLLPALVALVIAQMHATDAALDSAHLQGMQTGFSMCGAR